MISEKTLFHIKMEAHYKDSFIHQLKTA